MLRMALASNLRSREGGSKVFVMKLGKDFDKVGKDFDKVDKDFDKVDKDFDKVDGAAALRPKRRGCVPQRNEKGMYEEVNLVF